jgi:hypothetical protein
VGDKLGRVENDLIINERKMVRVDQLGMGICEYIIKRKEMGEWWEMMKRGALGWGTEA